MNRKNKQLLGGYSFWRTANQLRMGNEFTRRDAALTLIDRGGDRALPLLLKARWDSSRSVRLCVIWGLASIGDESVVEPLLEVLQDEQSWAELRQEAAKGLARLGWEPENARERALWAVANGRFAEAIQEGKAAVPSLIVALGDTDDAVALAAAKALAELADERALDSLVELLDHPAAAVRIEAVKALAALGNARAVKPLITVIIKDQTTDERVEAVRALGRFQDRSCVELLIQLLKDRDTVPRVRLEAVKTLAGMKDDRAIDPLTALIKEAPTGQDEDGEPEVERQTRMEAAKAGPP